jgi:hypothetical protein
MLKSRTHRCFGTDRSDAANAWRPRAGVPGVVYRLSSLGGRALTAVVGESGRPRPIEGAAMKDRLYTLI